MRLETGEHTLRVIAEAYTLTTAADRPYVYLDDPAGRRIADLFVPASAHTLEGPDDTIRVGEWEAREAEGTLTLCLSMQSSVWDGKTAILTCLPHRLTFHVEVQGRGRLSDVCVFGGYYSGQIRWGSGFFESGARFRKGFNPEPTTAETYTFAPDTGSVIDLTGVPVPGRDHWFFTPPPFGFAFETESGWLALGVEAAFGANRFTEYRYHGRQGAFHLSLAYDGQTVVDGAYTLPAIGMDFGRSDAYEALSAHADALRSQGLAPTIDALRHPAWWREPLFCGWGAQCETSSRQGGRAPDFARQSIYEGYLETLDANDVDPGIIVIDDKWQASYGNNDVDPAKWPDLRGFIDRQHQRGRHVLLWLKAWDPEGVPVEECVANAGRQPTAVDPTNPAFIERLQASVRRMLSPVGYDADGFKIDFTARIPAGPGQRLAGNLWGLELMKTYLGLIYRTAKEAKPDALVIAHTPHPYLADVIDMVRLNDVNTAHPVAPAMTHRARIAGLACPSALIDTDNWPMPNRSAWREYVTVQPTLGVPALYFATAIDSSHEPLKPEDYHLIRETWTAYRRSIKEEDHTR